MAKIQFIVDVARNDVLYYFMKGPIILADSILVLDRSNKVVDSFAIIEKGDCHNSIFIVVFW